jgi:hypothetical protein
VHVHHHDGVLSVIGDVTWQYPEPPDELWAALCALRDRRGASDRDLAALLGDDAPALVAVLDDVGALQHADHDFDAVAPTTGIAAYLDGALAQPKADLAALSATIIGVGAVGGEVARHLAASGFGRLVLVDFDVVSAANLNRQYLYGVADIGRRKIDAARDALARIAPSCAIDVVAARIAGPADLEALALPATSIVACCADTPPGDIARWIASYAQRRGAIFAAAAVGVRGGTWGPILVPGESPPAERAVLSPLDETLVRTVPVPLASFGPTNSWIAGALARDLVHVACGDDAPSRNTRVDIDFHTLDVVRTGAEPRS